MENETLRFDGLCLWQTVTAWKARQHANWEHRTHWLPSANIDHRSVFPVWGVKLGHAETNIFSLRYHGIFEQRLDVLPARERPNTPEGQLHNTGETFSGGISEDGALHMGRLHISAAWLDLPVAANHYLGDIDRVVVILRKAQWDRQTESLIWLIVSPPIAGYAITAFSYRLFPYEKLVYPYQSTGRSHNWTSF